MTGVEQRELQELTPGELALLLVQVEEEREIEELRAVVLGSAGELVSEEVRNDQV